MANLKKGLNYLGENKVELIILDTALLDGNNDDSILNFQQINMKIPVIFICDEDNESFALEFDRFGAQDFLFKSEIKKEVFLRSLRYALERNHLINQLQKSRDLEHHLAYHDFLTGLPNRLLFHDRLACALMQAKRLEKQAAILFLDLDGFKKINDTLGHSFGDQVLQVVAVRLKETIRESDTVARFGGDEFTVILFGLNDGKDTNKVAAKILEAIAKPYMINGHELFITASIGISIYPDDGAAADILIKNADIAMYRAKTGGKNNFMHYQLSMDASFFEHLSLENSLHRAIENENLVVYYQPQLNLNTGKIFCVEALVRWQHPEVGIILPDKFIPLAEETGLIIAIDEWVLHTACKQVKKWQESGFRDLNLAVNLSSRQFRQNDLVKKIEKILLEAHFNPQHLWLEITENKVIFNIDTTLTILKELKSLGLNLSLDDFGKGYSSLNYLKRFPIDMLKVDRAFVNGIPEDRNDMAISTAIVVLAKSMMLNVIAEGVETRQQIEFFKSLYCDAVQGNFLSKPVSADAITGILSSTYRKEISKARPAAILK